MLLTHEFEHVQELVHSPSDPAYSHVLLAECIDSDDAFSSYCSNSEDCPTTHALTHFDHSETDGESYDGSSVDDLASFLAGYDSPSLESLSEAEVEEAIGLWYMQSDDPLLCLETTVDVDGIVDAIADVAADVAADADADVTAAAIVEADADADAAAAAVVSPLADKSLRAVDTAPSSRKRRASTCPSPITAHDCDNTEAAAHSENIHTAKHVKITPSPVTPPTTIDDSAESRTIVDGRGAVRTVAHLTCPRCGTLFRRRDSVLRHLRKADETYGGVCKSKPGVVAWRK